MSALLPRPFCTAAGASSRRTCSVSNANSSSISAPSEHAVPQNGDPMAKPHSASNPRVACADLEDSDRRIEALERDREARVGADAVRCCRVHSMNFLNPSTDEEAAMNRDLFGGQQREQGIRIIGPQFPQRDPAAGQHREAAPPITARNRRGGLDRTQLGRQTFAIRHVFHG